MPTSSLRSPYSLQYAEREQILRDLWLRHDALWFEYYLGASDMAQLNSANRQIVERLAKYEMTTLIRKLRLYEPILCVGDIVDLFKFAADVFQTKNSPVSMTYTSDDRFRVTLSNCWACRSIERAGLMGDYACGPWMRLTGWLSAINVTAKVEPYPERCFAAERREARDCCEIEVVIEGTSLDASCRSAGMSK